MTEENPMASVFEIMAQLRRAGLAPTRQTPLQMRAQADMLEKKAQNLRQQAECVDRDDLDPGSRA